MIPRAFRYSDRCVHVLDIESQVVSAHVAVARRRRACPFELILEDLEGHAGLAAEHPKLPDHGPRIDPKTHLHPIVVRLERANLEDLDAADHLDKEPGRRFEVGHGETHMVRARKSRQSRLHLFETEFANHGHQPQLLQFEHLVLGLGEFLQMRHLHVLVPLRPVGPVLVERELGRIVVVLVQPVFDAASLDACGLDQAQ